MFYHQQKHNNLKIFINFIQNVKFFSYFYINKTDHDETKIDHF